MSVHPPQSEDLLFRFFSGDMSESDADRLAEYLQTYPSLRDFALEEFSLDLTLRSHEKPREILRNILAKIESKNSIDHLPDFDAMVRLAAEAPALRQNEKETTLRTPSSVLKPTTTGTFHRTRIMGTLLAVALICIVSVVYFEFQKQAKSFHVALRENPGVVWEDREYQKKDELIGKTIKFREGTMVLELRNGIELVLEGPATMEFRSLMEIACDKGRLNVHVPSNASGFSVETPLGKVVDLGTDFTLDVETDKMDIQVHKGAVEFTQRASSTAIPIRSGHALSYNVGGKATSVAFDPSVRRTGEDVRRHVRQRQAVWEEEEKRRLDDPSLLASMENAVLHGCRKVDGFQSSRPALRFSNPKQYADISFSGERQNLTLVAVARLNDMKNNANVLCTGNSFYDNPGEFLWQVDRSGSLQLHVHGKDIQLYSSPPVIGTEDRFAWLLFAVVVDAGKNEIRHYLNGKEIVTLPWKENRPLRLPKGTLGNVVSEQRERTSRFWNGDIGCFYAFSRVLSSKEIAEMFQNIR